jgi:hypothetical protein
MAVTYSRYEFLTVSILKRFRNGRFTSQTPLRRFKKWNRHLNPEVLKKIRWDFYEALDTIVFQGGDDGRGYIKYV